MTTRANVRAWMAAVGVALAGVVATVVARAQPQAIGNDAARAEALFGEGRRLMAAKDYGGACPKFAESQELDPAPGTLLNLAVCYERAGKTASAWAAFKSAYTAAQNAGQRQRAAAAAAKAAELEPKLSHIAISVAPASRVPSLEVRCDGNPMGEALWGVALPYDPGPHEIEATAPGHRKWSNHLDLQDNGQRVDIDIPALEAEPVPASTTTVAPSANPSPARLLARSPADSRVDGRALRIAGVAVSAVGVAALAFGTYAYINAKSLYDEALKDCGGNGACDPRTSLGRQGAANRPDASTWGAASVASIAAGGVGLATGLILYFTAPRTREAPPSVSLGPASHGTGVSLFGTF
jgi:tetratricopeptide (TPR) repeat protein